MPDLELVSLSLQNIVCRPCGQVCQFRLQTTITPVQLCRHEHAGALQMHRRLRSGCNGLPDDYMCIIQQVIGELLEWVPFLSQIR